MENDPLSISKKELTIHIKVLGNFIKKVGKKYEICESSINEIILMMHDILATFNILINISGFSLKSNQRSFYENNIGWSMNCAYTNLFNIINNIKNNPNNHRNLEKFLMEDTEFFHNGYNKIRYWSKYNIIPSEEEYFVTVKAKFPINFFCNTLANYSNKIDDNHYNKLHKFMENFIRCKNFRIDYKVFFETYLTKYDEYYINYVIIYFLERYSDKKEEVNILLKNIDKIENKLKLLKIMNDCDFPNTIYKDLQEKQNEIVVQAKELFSMTQSFRQISDFDITEAEKFYEKYTI
jgi:hypothetical protein